MSYFSDTIKLINQLESIDEVFFFRFRNVDIWRSIRVKIGYKKYGLHTITRSTNTKSHTKLSIIKKDLLFAEKNLPLIVEGNKKDLVDGIYIDSISQPYKLVPHISLDTDSFRGVYYNVDKEYHYFSTFKGLFNKLYPILLTKDEIDSIIILLSKINLVMGENFFSKKELIDIIKTEYINYRYYKLALSRVHPTSVTLPASYINTALVQAANDLNIDTIEIQYALISKIHIGFSTNRTEKMKFYPKTFIVWSKYWEKEYLFPCTIKASSNNNTAVDEKKNKRVLIVSQEVIKDEVLDFTIKLIENNPGYDIYLRPHPWDTTNYPTYINISNNSSMRNDILNSEVVITTFSTSFYESLKLKRKVFIIENSTNDVFDEDVSSITIDSKVDIKSLVDDYNFTINEL